MSGPERITLAVTGASGMPYALRLLDCLVREDREVHFLISKAAQLVMATETDVSLPPKPQAMQAFLTEYTGAAAGQIRVYGKEDWMSPVASGSGAPAAMVATVGLLSVEERTTLDVASYVLKGFQSAPATWHPGRDLGCVLPSKGPLVVAFALNVHVLNTMGLLDENDLNLTQDWWPGDLTLAECLPKLRRFIPSEVCGVIEAGVSMGLEYRDMIVLACSAMERTWQHDAITSIEVPLPVLEEAGL